MAGALQEMEKG
uniref:Uncharacterized protein n=1 Tax=Anguilla anguilla TaxID=7936 RepID=A0A0E9W7Q1_ANGAN